MFCSTSLRLHLLRGAAALALMAVAAWIGARDPLLSVLPVVGAVVLLRGCPMCWTLQLVQSLRSRRCAAPACPKDPR